MMAEPPRPPVGNTRDGNAARPTGEPDPAPAGVEPSPLPSAPLKFDVQHIAVDKVLVVGTRRAVNDEAVAALVVSIGLIGLRTPIAVRILEDESQSQAVEVADPAYVLVAGLHRLEACRKLGWQDIPAIVHDWKPREAELWEIEENLARAELTLDEKTEHTMRLTAVLKEMEESLKDSDFPKQGAPTTGCGHKGTIQKVAERIGVNQGTIRNRIKNAEAMIGEPVNLNRDPPAELKRKADKLKATGADHKAGRKAARNKERSKTQAPKPAHKDREKTHVARPPRQPDLTADIRDLNVRWPREAVEADTANLIDQKKADLRQHLPDLMDKFQWVRSTIAAVDEASCADQPSVSGSN